MRVQNVLPRDAIPSIDDPSFGSTYFGSPDDEVIVVEADDGPARAYPIRILSYHEIVNDSLDGRPIAVTWCPICWSAVVYDRRVADRTLTFGTSGKLADDALVMYDRETESEWKQPTGAAFDGELAGERLDVLSASMLSWETFEEAYPDGMVLQPVRGTEEGTGPTPAAAYDMAPYEEYAAGDEFGLYEMRGEGEPRSWDREDLDAKTIVLGVERGGEAVGYPLPRVEAAGGLVTDTVGDRPLLVVASDDGLQAFADPGFAFELRNGVLHADGSTWDAATGTSETAPDFDRVPARRLFAFAWQDAHGPDSFFSPT